MTDPCYDAIGMVLFYSVRLKCSVAFIKSSQFSKGDISEVDDDADNAETDSEASVSLSVVEEEEISVLEESGTGSSYK
jgi:hypothetical protein